MLITVLVWTMVVVCSEYCMMFMKMVHWKLLVMISSVAFQYQYLICTEKVLVTVFKSMSCAFSKSLELLFYNGQYYYTLKNIMPYCHKIETKCKPQAPN